MDVSSSVSSVRSTPAVVGARQLLADYFELTKPKVQTLLLFTTIGTGEANMWWAHTSVARTAMTAVEAAIAL